MRPLRLQLQQRRQRQLLQNRPQQQRLKEKERKAKEAQQTKVSGGSTGGIPTIAHHAQNTSLPEDHDDWELSEGDLLEGSNLSGNKALLEEYPEDEANSKRYKKNNTGKGKKSDPKTKA
jgi:hypothetical protein